MIDVVNAASITQLNFTIVSAILLLGVTLVLTILPKKNKDWDNAEDRV